MASAQVVETSVNTIHSPFQDYTANPNDHSNHNIDSLGFKPFTVIRTFSDKARDKGGGGGNLPISWVVVRRPNLQIMTLFQQISIQYFRPDETLVINKLANKNTMVVCLFLTRAEGDELRFRRCVFFFVIFGFFSVSHLNMQASFACVLGLVTCQGHMHRWQSG